MTLTFKLVRARDQTRLPCECCANPMSGFRDISHPNKNHRGRQKQNLPQFTACGKYGLTNHSRFAIKSISAFSTVIKAAGDVTLEVCKLLIIKPSKIFFRYSFVNRIQIFYAIAVLAMALCPSVTNRCCIETTKRIDLFWRIEAVLGLSYTVL